MMTVYKLAKPLATLALLTFGSAGSYAQDFAVTGDICKVCTCDRGHVNCLRFDFNAENKEVIFRTPVPKDELSKTIEQLDLVAKATR